MRQQIGALSCPEVGVRLCYPSSAARHRQL
jgi:hypothetical protein